jgi:hypothetical protein
MRWLSLKMLCKYMYKTRIHTQILPPKPDIDGAGLPRQIMVSSTGNMLQLRLRCKASLASILCFALLPLWVRRLQSRERGRASTPLRIVFDARM